MCRYFIIRVDGTMMMFSAALMHAGSGRGVCGCDAAAAGGPDWSTDIVGMKTPPRCDGGDDGGPDSSSGYCCSHSVDRYVVSLDCESCSDATESYDRWMHMHTEYTCRASHLCASSGAAAGTPSGGCCSCSVDSCVLSLLRGRPGVFSVSAWRRRSCGRVRSRSLWPPVHPRPVFFSGPSSGWCWNEAPPPSWTLVQSGDRLVLLYRGSVTPPPSSALSSGCDSSPCCGSSSEAEAPPSWRPSNHSGYSRSLHLCGVTAHARPAFVVMTASKDTRHTTDSAS